MTVYRALSDFEVNYPHPLEVALGDKVKLGRRDLTWAEWIWVTREGEKVGSWMHESMLTSTQGDEAEVREAYSAREISLRKGDQVRSLRELGGWHWCEKADGTLGWVPDYVLERV
jgi:hypothetical protein